MADHKCCCIHLLQSQPDFVSQRSVLAETVEASGHIFELYPRFHCECNPIERYWGAAKRVARRECTYSFRDLNSNIHDFLDSVSPPNEEPLQIRRYFNRSFRYIEAYSEGKDVNRPWEIVREFSKLQKSHRTLRLNQ